MKLLIYTQVWKRPEITQICFIGINRLIKLCPEYNIKAIAVISEEEMIPLCELYGIEWTMCDNLPLGRKHNHGINYALKYDWDYVMNIGSDDIVSHKIFEHYKPYFDEGCDFFGLNTIGFFDSYTQNLICSITDTEIPFGAARVMSRKLIEQVNPFWPDELNKGLDRGSQANAINKGFQVSTVKTINEPLCIDIKSSVNIWSFKNYSGINVENSYISTNFSSRELKLLLSLKERLPMSVKIYEYRGMTRASIKVFTPQEVIVDFTGGGNIGGQDGSPKLIPPQAAIHDETIQKQIENHPLFHSGTIVLKLDTNIDPNEVIKFEDEEKEEWDIVEEVSNQNQAAFYLRNRFPEVKVTDINSKAKIKAVSEAKKIKFPNLKLD